MRTRSSFAVPDAAFIAVPTLDQIAVDVPVKLDFAALTARFAVNQAPNAFPAFAVDLTSNAMACLASRCKCMPVAWPSLPPFPVTKKSPLL
jgi:hypothetical protein